MKKTHPLIIEGKKPDRVRDALKHAAKGGVMGSHHFNIAFATQAQGVEIGGHGTRHAADQEDAAIGQVDQRQIAQFLPH